MYEQVGRLYLCGTPIGNLEDMTLRALSTLKTCDVVYAEDTRHSIKLLTHFEIKKPLYSYHEHNAEAVGPQILEKVQRGERVAVITDAGMPGISDPGAHLVRLCIDAAIPFEIIPGVTAFTTALVGSGLSTDQFVFEGFPSRDKRQRRALFEGLSSERRTLIFYESPHRLHAMLKDLYAAFGERQIVIARELTKRHETFHRGSLSQFVAEDTAREFKGEMVVVVDGRSDDGAGGSDVSEAPSDAVLLLMIKERLAAGMDKKEALKAVAKHWGLKKSDLYALWESALGESEDGDEG